ncbi:MAG: hypothetical protein WC967_15930 [Balneolaceae bacterium]
MAPILPLAKTKQILATIKKIETGAIKPSSFAKPLAAVAGTSAPPHTQQYAKSLYQVLSGIGNTSNGASKVLKRKAVDTYANYLMSSRLLKTSGEHVALTSEYLVSALRKESKAPDFVSYLSALFRGKPSAVRYALKLKSVAPTRFSPFVQNAAATKWSLLEAGRVPAHLQHTAKRAYTDLIQAKEAFQGASKTAAAVQKLKQTPIADNAAFKQVIGKVNAVRGLPMQW